jgi:polyisoprenoid-binding protein YceI
MQTLRLAGLLVLVLGLSVNVQAKDYEIDLSHSSIGFSVRHLVGKVNGAFRDFTGTFSFDPKSPESSKVIAEVKAKSIDTNDKKRDEHLRGKDFFEVQKHTGIKFVSTEVKEAGNQKYQVVGNLTLHGVTRPMTLTMEYMGEINDPWGKHRAGFSGTGQLDRKNFDMTWNKALDHGGMVIGDTVDFQLNIEAIEKKAN